MPTPATYKGSNLTGIWPEPADCHLGAIGLPAPTRPGPARRLYRRPLATSDPTGRPGLALTRTCQPEWPTSESLAGCPQCDSHGSRRSGWPGPSPATSCTNPSHGDAPGRGEVTTLPVAVRATGQAGHPLAAAASSLSGLFERASESASDPAARILAPASSWPRGHGGHSPRPCAGRVRRPGPACQRNPHGHRASGRSQHPGRRS